MEHFEERMKIKDEENENKIKFLVEQCQRLELMAMR